MYSVPIIIQTHEITGYIHAHTHVLAWVTLTRTHTYGHALALKHAGKHTLSLDDTHSYSPTNEGPAWKHICTPTRLDARALSFTRVQALGYDYNTSTPTRTWNLVFSHRRNMRRIIRHVEEHIIRHKGTHTHTHTSSSPLIFIPHTNTTTASIATSNHNPITTIVTLWFIPHTVTVTTVIE